MYHETCDVRPGDDYITSYRTNIRLYEAINPYKYIFVGVWQPIYIFLNYLVSICTLSVAVPVLAWIYSVSWKFSVIAKNTSKWIECKCCMPRTTQNEVNQTYKLEFGPTRHDIYVLYRNIHFCTVYTAPLSLKAW
jgi:hypothetical protein